jgi:hypothetical protein
MFFAYAPLILLKSIMFIPLLNFIMEMYFILSVRIQYECRICGRRATCEKSKLGNPLDTPTALVAGNKNARISASDLHYASITLQQIKLSHIFRFPFSKPSLAENPSIRLLINVHNFSYQMR